MITRRFGRTEIDMPVLSTGGMRYQMNWSGPKPEELDPANQKNIEDILDKSLAVGCRHIETARGYGTSEYQLGLALKRFKREDFILQTKVGPTENPKDFKQNLDLSFELLQVERIDLFAFHGLNLPEHTDWILRDGGCMEVIKEYQRRGKIGSIGFSTHGLSQDITDAIRSDAFDYVNLHWYFIDRSNDACLDAAKDHDMGLFIISPTDKGGKLYDPPAKLVELTQPFSPIGFNDIFTLNDPRVHTISLGVAKPEEFDEHLKAIEQLENPQLQTRFQETLKTMENHFMESIGGELLSSIQNFPSYQTVPHHVNLKVIFRLWSLAKAFDMVEYGKMRYNLLGNGGHWFPGIKPSDEHLSDVLDHLSKHPQAEALSQALHQSIAWFKGEEQQRLSKS